MFYEEIIVIAAAKMSVLHCHPLCYNNKVICVKTTMLLYYIYKVVQVLYYIAVYSLAATAIANFAIGG